MQGLCSTSTLIRAPEKARVEQPLLIFSPHLALGIPENAGVTSHFRPLLDTRGDRSEVATSDFLPTLGVGDPREWRR